jgi:class 3 adenylate cyclase
MSLPTGTVTFLLTDVEGSTKLWEDHPEAMRAALARHDAMAVSTAERCNGSVIKSRGEGDSLFMVFGRASDAVQAAAALQQAYHEEPWPQDAPLRVRMALHTGEAELRDADYYGPTVNRCARLRAIGHGGQVLLSEATEAMVRDSLPEGASLRDVGSYVLKDLRRSAEHVYQLVSAGVPTITSPLRSLQPNNLPQQLTSFVGRAKEIQEIRELMGKTRLVTVTGAGGSGKTRLTLEVASDLLLGEGDGVWFVELAPHSDPALVPQSVAFTLGVREEPDRPVTDTLVDHLRSRRAVIVLDNCEHLLGACATLVDSLVKSCPDVRVLCTSREALGINGETTYRIPSLSVPDAKGPAKAEVLSKYEAVTLFVDRAQAAQPGFTLTDQNAAAVAQICVRLDGIPLAIELAAARVKAMSVDQIATRLDDRFRLLTGGSRTALPRQQTLRAMIDWSYDLLSEKEQVLLRRLSVFVGGWTLEAAEKVCADPPPDAGSGQAALSAMP